MALQFTTANQASADNGVKCLVYGQAGMGKTVLTATLPTPVLISAESGLLSLRKENLERIYGVGVEGINYDVPVIVINSVDDLTEAYRWASTSAEAANFQSVALDSISEIAEVVLNNAKRQVKDPRQAYGELLEKMQTLVRLFRDLPKKNVYFSAKMEHGKDELSGITMYQPAMPGAKLGSQLPYFFDEVFRLGTSRDQNGQNFRFLQTQPDLQFVAKDRSGALDAMEYPHLGAIFAKIMGVAH